MSRVLSGHAGLGPSRCTQVEAGLQQVQLLDILAKGLALSQGLKGAVSGVLGVRSVHHTSGLQPAKHAQLNGCCVVYSFRSLAPPVWTIIVQLSHVSVASGLKHEQLQVG